VTRTHVLGASILLLGVMLFGWGRLHQGPERHASFDFQTGALGAGVQRVIFGPFRGWGADYNLLMLFNVYDRIIQAGTVEQRKKQLWQYVAQRLQAASHLDPSFKDTYRLTSGLLAFHEGQAALAVDLLMRGASSRPWDWEEPLLAGFLAETYLHQHEKAVDLLNMAARRPNAPPLAIGLASRIVLRQAGPETAIEFLEKIRAGLPRAYQREIDKRIRRLRAEHREGQ